MKLTYDPRYNIAYLRLHEKKAEVETIKVSDEINISKTNKDRDKVPCHISVPFWACFAIIY